MIGYLKGQLVETTMDHLIIDVNGVGYEAAASLQTMDQLQSLKDQTVALLIYTHVREDQLQLFAFLHAEEKALFLSFLKVNGIGPRVALSILSGAPWSQIYEFIEKGDAKALSSLPKVGKKTAEQIILTLQGKLVRVDDKKKSSGPTQSQQISFALVNLGFKSSIVDSFVSSLSKDVNIEEGVRQGLLTLSKN